MAKKTVKVLINIGTIDAARLGLGVDDLFLEGDVISVDEKIAEKLVRERLAKEYDSATRKEDEERAERAREADIRAALPAVEREAALEEAKTEAAKRVKAGPKETVKTVETNPETVTKNPHSPAGPVPVRKES